MVEEWVDFVVNEAAEQLAGRPLALGDLERFRNRELVTKGLQ